VQSPPRAFAEPTDCYLMKLCLISATDSCNVTLSRTSVLAIPLESALTKNAPAKRLESALAKSLDLKSPEMNIYETRTGVNFFFY